MSSEIHNSNDELKNQNNHESRSFDPDKKMDITESKNAEAAESKYDPDKRVEISTQDGTDSKENDANMNTIPSENIEEKESAEPRYNGLTDAEKTKLKEETGWSDKIIDYIRSPEEAEIYKSANLQECEINGRACLIRDDIDMDVKDDDGLTNRERMEEGKAPIVDGRPIELHHIGQKDDSPLAELTYSEHHANGNYNILHDTSKDSEVDHPGFKNIRENHWSTRLSDGGEQS